MKNILILSTKDLRKKSGIYILKCKNRSYIGSSKSLYARLYEHRLKLKNKKHSNDFMQNACNKYGIESFYYEVLEFCDPDKRIIKEKEWMNKLNPEFNLQLDPVDRTLSKYSKQKLSESIKKGVKEGKYKKPKYENSKIEHYDYFGNLVNTYNSIEEAVKILNIPRKKITNLCGGYKKGLILDGIRLRYSNSEVPVQRFPLNPNYIGKYVEFYCDDEIAFKGIKDVWSFIGKKALDLESGKNEFTIKMKLINFKTKGNPD